MTNKLNSSQKQELHDLLHEIFGSGGLDDDLKRIEDLFNRAGLNEHTGNPGQLDNDWITEIINEVEDQHPYKQRGNPDSYSKYSEGWADACDVIRTKLELDDPTSQESLPSPFGDEPDTGPCIECKHSHSYKSDIGWFCRLKNSPIRVGVDTCDKFDRLFEQQQDEPPETEDWGGLADNH